MGAVVITVRHNLSLWGATSKKNLPSEPKFGESRVRMFATRNRREAPHHRAQRGHIASGKWLQFWLNRSQSMGFLAYFLSVTRRLPRCARQVEWFNCPAMVLEMEQHGCERHGPAAWCRNFHSLWRFWVGLDGGCCCGSKTAVVGGSGWCDGAVRRA